MTLWPLTMPSPAVARSSVARKRIVVLLPAPLGPMKPNISPAPILRFKFDDGDEFAVDLGEVVKFDHEEKDTGCRGQGKSAYCLELDGFVVVGFFVFDFLSGVAVLYRRLQRGVAEVNDDEGCAAYLRGGRCDRLAGQDFVEAGN